MAETTRKIKISELAKDFLLSSKDIIAVIKDITGEEKK